MDSNYTKITKNVTLYFIVISIENFIMVITNNCYKSKIAFILDKALEWNVRLRYIY